MCVVCVCHISIIDALMADCRGSHGSAGSTDPFYIRTIMRLNSSNASAGGEQSGDSVSLECGVLQQKRLFHILPSVAAW